MQEKSSTRLQKQWETTLDSLIDYVRRHDDFIIGAGVGLPLGALISLTFLLCVTSQ